MSKKEPSTRVLTELGGGGVSCLVYLVPPTLVPVQACSHLAAPSQLLVASEQNPKPRTE